MKSLYISYFIIFLFIATESLQLNRKFSFFTKAKNNYSFSNLKESFTKSKQEPVTSFTILSVIKTVNYFINKYYNYYDLNQLDKLKAKREDSSQKYMNIGLESELLISESCAHMKSYLSWNRILLVTKTLDTYINYLKILSHQDKFPEQTKDTCINNEKRQAERHRLIRNFKVLSKEFKNISMKFENRSIDKSYKKKIQLDLVRSKSCNNIKTILIEQIPKDIALLTKNLLDKNSYLIDLVCSNDNNIQKDIRDDLNESMKEIDKLEKLIDENDDKVLFSLIGKLSNTPEEKMKFVEDKSLNVAGELKYEVEIDGESVEKFLLGARSAEIIELINTFAEASNIVKDLKDEDNKTGAILDLIDFSQKQIVSLINDSTSHTIKDYLEKGSDIASSSLKLIKNLIEYHKEEDPETKYKKKLDIYGTIDNMLAISTDFFLNISIPVEVVKIIADFVLKRKSYNHTLEIAKRDKYNLDSNVLNFQNQAVDINKNNIFYKCEALANTQEFINNIDKFSVDNSDNNKFNYLEIIKENYDSLNDWQSTLEEVCKIYSQICIDSDIIKYSINDKFIGKLRTISYYGHYSDIIVVRNFNEFEIALRLGYDYITGSFDNAFGDYKQHDFSGSTVGDILNSIKDKTKKFTINEYLNRNINILLGCRGCSTKSYIGAIGIINKEIATKKYKDSLDPVIDYFEDVYLKDNPKGDIRILSYGNDDYVVYNLVEFKSTDKVVKAFKQVIDTSSNKFLIVDYNIQEGRFENNFVDLSEFVENVDTIDESEKITDTKNHIANLTFEFKLIEKECYHSDENKFNNHVHILDTIIFKGKDYYFVIIESNLFKNNECLINLDKNQYNAFLDKGKKNLDELNHITKIYNENNKPDDNLRLFSKQAYITGLDIGYDMDPIIIDFLSRFFKKIFKEENVGMSYLHLANHKIKKFYIIYHKDNIYETSRSISSQIESNISDYSICGNNSGCLFYDDKKSQIDENENFSGLLDKFKDYRLINGNNLSKCTDGFNKIFDIPRKLSKSKKNSDEKLEDHAFKKILSHGFNDIHKSNVFSISPKINSSNIHLLSNCNYIVYNKHVRFDNIHKYLKTSFYGIGVDFTNKDEPEVVVNEIVYGPGINSIVWIEYTLENSDDDNNSSDVAKFKLENLQKAVNQGYSLYVFNGKSEFELNIKGIEIKLSFRLFYKYRRVLNKMRKDLCPKKKNKE